MLFYNVFFNGFFQDSRRGEPLALYNVVCHVANHVLDGLLFNLTCLMLSFFMVQVKDAVHSSQYSCTNYFDSSVLILLKVLCHNSIKSFLLDSVVMAADIKKWYPCIKYETFFIKY